MNYRLRPRNITYVCITLVSLLWFGAIAVRATDRYVVEPGTPGGTNAGPYTNWNIAATQIQWAVNAAAAGETVWVTNGTYYLTNEISVGNVILQSVNGMGKTFINGNYPAYTNRCLYINSTGAVVKGFTIMNAYSTNNVDGIAGGGVLLYSGTLRNCHITTNVGVYGGGVQITGVGSIYDCIISSNSSTTSAGLGGGLYSTGRSNIINNCVFIGNVVGNRGGGMFLHGVSASDNRAHTVINCVFIGNRAGTGDYTFGGGVLVSGANNTFRNCVFDGNTDSSTFNSAGGVMLYTASNTKIQNCTFARNTTEALYHWPDLAGALVENCIFVSNTYSTSQASTTNRNNRTDSPIAAGVNTNNITTNPSFVNYAAGNFRLAKGSPCINTGTNNLDWMTGAIDLDGRIRIRYGTGDMGAYEYIAAGTIFSFH